METINMNEMEKVRNEICRMLPEFSSDDRGMIKDRIGSHPQTYALVTKLYQGPDTWDYLKRLAKLARFVENYAFLEEDEAEACEESEGKESESREGSEGKGSESREESEGKVSESRVGPEGKEFESCEGPAEGKESEACEGPAEAEESEPGRSSLRILPLNTYPLSIRTDEIYEEFLGISCQDSQSGMPFKMALESALSYCKNYEKLGKNYPNPSITILTDRWFPTIFNRAEESFIKYAIEINVDIHFFLVDHFRISEVHFLDADILKHLRKKYKKRILPVRKAQDDLDLLPESFAYCRLEEGSRTEKTGNIVCYEFFKQRCCWHCFDRSGMERSGRLKKSDLRAFARKITDLGIYDITGKKVEISLDSVPQEDADQWAGTLGIFDQEIHFKLAGGGRKNRRIKRAADELVMSFIRQ